MAISGNKVILIIFVRLIRLFKLIQSTTLINQIVLNITGLLLGFNASSMETRFEDFWLRISIWLSDEAGDLFTGSLIFEHIFVKISEKQTYQNQCISFRRNNLHDPTKIDIVEN